MVTTATPMDLDTRMTDLPRRFDVIVVGGGQAGLAAGYHLAQRGLRFIILDAHDRVGDSWRQRWDSLRLFTPARYDGLPGMPFPAAPHTFPTGGEMAGYLEHYAAAMKLPVRCGVTVDRVERSAAGRDGYIVHAGDLRLTTDQVVIATSAYLEPRAPDLANDLNPGIRQIHSASYRNPAQFAEGAVLVVGASNSGAEIALEAARGHQVILSGRDPGKVPFRVDTRAARLAFRILWFAWNHVLTANTPVGRKMRPKVRNHGGPLVRVKPSDLTAAGVERTYERTTGTDQGLPVLEGGRVLEVANVVWCTGFHHDFSWIDGLELDEDGFPRQDLGVAHNLPGVYFVGLKFQRAFSSMLVGGAGRDAAHVAQCAASLAASGASQISA